MAPALCLVLRAAAPATGPGEGKLPHVQVDVKARQVRVECEAVNAEMPLEFFSCLVNTSEHETVLRTKAKPSHIHLGLLMLGLQPGEPLKYNKAADKWIPPQGPPLHIFCEFERDGQTVKVPAYRLMRNTKTKKEMPPLTWVFCGSRQMDDGAYAADSTGYVVTLVNFDFALIDIPQIASNANETLEWEINPDAVPRKGSRVWMLIEPAGKAANPSTRASTDEPRVIELKLGPGPVIHMEGQPVALRELPSRLKDLPAAEARIIEMPDAGADLHNKVAGALKAAGITLVSTQKADARMSEVTLDEARVKALRARWETAMAPHRKELASAAQTHYEVIAALRREQQRLIDESDRIQRVIDEIQRQYQDITTPRPVE